MTREDVQELLAMIQGTYTNFNPANKTVTVNAWLLALQEFDRALIESAFAMYIKTETKGFPPTPGKLIENAKILTQPQELNPLEAWVLVKNALSNSGYHAVEEFSKLPDVVQKAVGSPNQLKEWATTQDFNTEVAKSLFIQSYKIEVARKEEFEKLPTKYQELIKSINVNSNKAQIGQNNQRMIKLSTKDKNGENKAKNDIKNGIPMPLHIKSKLQEMKNGG